MVTETRVQDPNWHRGKRFIEKGDLVLVTPGNGQRRWKGTFLGADLDAETANVYGPIGTGRAPIHRTIDLNTIKFSERPANPHFPEFRPPNRRTKR